MKKHIEFLASFSLVLLAATSSNVYADDTEIFFNEEALADVEEFQPNVLFVFDTSGSMGWNITSKEPYVPGTNYCSGICDDTVYIYDTDYDYKNKTIPIGQNSCQGMIDFLATNTDTPVYIKKAAEWRKKNGNWKWRNIKNSTNTIECQEDAGTHGVDSSSTDIYAANGNDGPYSSSANDAISWSSLNDRLYVSANYHNYLQTAASVTRIKMDVMKEAAIDLVNEFDGLNIGLMRFDGSSGGYVKHHFSDIETDRTQIVNDINALTANGNTPLTETLWEAHKYFLGGSVEYGTNTNRDSAAVSSSNYNSPVADSDSSCQNNYVVYLTDGQPYSDSGKDTVIRGLTNTNDTTCDHSDGTSDADNTCLDELSGYMASYDYNDVLDGTQNVITHTIGFAIDMDLLEQTAIDGNGTYHTANSSQELKTAFNEIILDILSNSTTFTAPAVSVNAYNSLQNRDELYYAIFEPNIYPRWTGNVKKYRINSDGQVLDANDQLAIEPSTGYFKSEAESYWGNVSDGPVVKKGGASSQLTNSRNVFTVSGNAAEDNLNLNTTANKITDGNAAITVELLGIDEDTYPDPNDLADARTLLISWILGVDVNDDNENSDNTDANNYMADPLHSRPIVVTYGGDNSDPDNIILDDILFTTTNDGAFHAVDTSDGQELFAFIPQDLLPNQLDYFTDDPDGTRRYGLDGPMTIWREENDASDDPDVNIESDEGDHVYAYFGMRRGGNNYYAMDVTDKTNPKLMWTIFGDNETVHPDFKDMGQTWSRPILSRVNWDCDTNGENCTSKPVLFFGGGYDTVHDNATNFTTGDKGAAIYMVDALNGDLLWSAGDQDVNSDHTLDLKIKNSIPGDVTVADLNGDGADDILFALDIQGNLWRIDFNSESQSASDFAQDGLNNDTGGKIANIQDTDTGTDLSDPSDDAFRRFFTGPTVSLSKKRGQEPFFVITFGSGNVSHPKEISVTDRLYSVFERDVFSPPRNTSDQISYTTVDNDDLIDMTDADADPADPTADPDVDASGYHGFYRDATASGEKFLRRALTIFGQTLYTSYLPLGSDNEINTTCGSEYLGSSRIYSIDFVTGKSVYTGEYIDLKHPGIAPEPAVLFISGPDGTKTNLCIGTECQTSKLDPDTGECEEGSFNCLPDPSLDIKSWRENLQ